MGKHLLVGRAHFMALGRRRMGAWLGFGGYLRLPHNADSFAMVFALGYFYFFSCIGRVIGMASGALVGGLVEKTLRHLGVRITIAVSVATLVNALVLWQLAGFVQMKFTGLLSPEANPPVSRQRGSSLKIFMPPPPPEQSAFEGG